VKIKTAMEIAARARLHPPRSADAVRDTRGRFLAGTAPGPGKPLGGRGRLAAALVDDLLREWPRSGSHSKIGAGAPVSLSEIDGSHCHAVAQAE
jgi:hypothetical protein